MDHLKSLATTQSDERVAGILLRMASWVLDSLVFGAAAFAVFVVLCVLLLVALWLQPVFTHQLWNARSAAKHLADLFALVLPFLWCLYLARFESSSSQATPGMRLVGLKAITYSGDKISFKRAFLRPIVQAILLIFIYGFGGMVGCLLCAFKITKQYELFATIAYLLAFWIAHIPLLSNGTQSLPDKISGIRIIRKRRPTKP